VADGGVVCLFVIGFLVKVLKVLKILCVSTMNILSTLTGRKHGSLQKTKLQIRSLARARLCYKHWREGQGFVFDPQLRVFFRHGVESCPRAVRREIEPAGLSTRVRDRI
jgi:hypothetical protein